MNSVSHDPSNDPQQAFVRLPESTRLGYAHLRTPDAGNSLAFYRDLLGLHEIRSTGATTILSASPSEDPIILITEDPQAKPRPVPSSGLFHVALLFPTRRDLAVAFRGLYEHQWPFQGFADHGVSEALYLADADGNGIELYADRPRERWPYKNGQLQMVTEQMDLDGLLAELRNSDKQASTDSSRMTIGHIHLQVSHLPPAEEFYHRTLGFDITQKSYPGALFLSAGGYHHHIGVNTWNSYGASAAPPQSVGLMGFGIHLGDEDATRLLANRLRQTQYWSGETDHGFLLHDTDHNQIEVS